MPFDVTAIMTGLVTVFMTGLVTAFMTVTAFIGDCVGDYVYR